MRWRRLSRLACAGLVAALALSGCASPTDKLLARSHQEGLQTYTVTGADFEHLVLVSHNWAEGEVLHVYLEHDGAPWITPTRIASDPTPTRPVAFDLLISDPAPRLYLGRPCYFGRAGQAACQPAMWTDRRYSNDVVRSLAAALETMLRRRPPCRVVLIGHSGGGTLAVLLAPRLREVDAIVTLAANLDVAAWSALHRYTPLGGSLDPMTQPVLRPEVRQLHVAGAQDVNVPVDLVRRYVRRQTGARLEVLPEEDHLCCWARHWPALIDRLPGGRAFRPQ